ncbi:MAG: hypothetical protein KTR24_07865 [Saprospiraceae bacterium]|nr:hypothetical protein [Saprospiraceae bacterium]
MQKQKLAFEIIWILLAAVAVVLVLLPIRSHVPDYPFEISNAIFIFTFITVARILFTLKYSVWGRIQWLKAVLVFLCIPLVFNLVNSFNSFLAYMDDYTLSSFLDHLDKSKELQLEKYIRSEMIFFATGSIISSILLPFRLIISLWRQRNRGTV